jgi:hypothetical protein
MYVLEGWKKIISRYRMTRMDETSMPPPRSAITPDEWQQTSCSVQNWIGDDGADRPIHIRDQAQAGFADETLQGAGNGAPPGVCLLHGFTR